MKTGLGYIIKKYREAHNYDQASLARLAGVSRGQVVYIENDKSTQKEEQLEKLAGAMNTTWKDLVIADSLPKWMDAGKEPNLLDENGRIKPEIILQILKDALDDSSREYILLAEIIELRHRRHIEINIQQERNGSNNNR